MRLLYSVLLYLFSPFILLRLLIRGRKAPAYLNRWAERFAYYQGAQTGSVIWFHTVSVGEAEAAFPLINQLAELYPASEILVTTTTPTGSARVKAFLGHRVQHVYLPYDTPGAMRRFYRRFKPRIGIILETEIWPNMLHQAKQHGVPTLIVNARLSEKSAKAYARLASFTRQTLADITQVCAQTELSAERFIALGLAPEKVSVPGNIKFDMRLPANLSEQAEVIRRDWFQQRPSWIAASTHDGEDGKILDAFAELKQEFSNSLLVLVPRHPERFDAVAKLCEKRGYSVTRRSEHRGTRVSSDVFLLDSLGELRLYYGTVDVAFVGGSLVPTGGHNMLEPAALAVPILFGPYVHNFTDISQRLLEQQAAAQVADQQQLASQLIDLLRHSEKRDQMGSAGQRFVEQNKGAVENVAQQIVCVLGE
ncbi:3-deoxy-D-manno-octulosonic acid transferase [Cycloclasticus sp. 46_120_T64]|nr:3-deoxy-D-manno-octulosonic acid transferase [Cycloclasticus sp. 46_120_T64]